MSLTKEDLSQIKAVMKDALSTHPTKAELKAELSRFATKQDLKTELDRLEARLTFSMGLLERDAYNRLDDHEQRLQRLEQARPR